MVLQALQSEQWSLICLCLKSVCMHPQRQLSSHPKALDLFSQIKGNGTMLDVIAHTAIIDAYANIGQPKEVSSTCRCSPPCPSTARYLGLFFLINFVLLQHRPPSTFVLLRVCSSSGTRTMQQVPSRNQNRNMQVPNQTRPVCIPSPY